MLSFLNKADLLAQTHTESRSCWDANYPKDQSLSRAQTAEFALKKFQEEQRLSQNLWLGVRQAQTLTKKAQSFIGWSSLKIGQFLTFAPAQRTLEQNFESTTLALLSKKLPESLISSKSVTSKVPEEEVSRIYQEAFKGRVGSLIQDTKINPNTISSSTSTQEGSITKTVKNCAIDSAEKTHDFQKAIGFYVPLSIAAIALAAKVAPLALSNRSK